MNHMRYKNEASIFEVNILYLLLGIGLLTFGSAVQNRDLFSGLLITEFILILLPCLLFIKSKGFSIKESLRLNKIGLRQAILVMLITLFTYPLAVFFQAIFIAILNIFRDLTPSGVPLPNDGGQFIISFFVMAIAPGICEEVMFRGVLLNGYRKLGYKKSIIITALLFGIFHFNIMNFVGPTVLGIVFGVLVYKTNSLYSAIIGHITNNWIALSIGFFLNKFRDSIDAMEMEAGAVTGNVFFEIGNIILIVIFLALCFIVVKSLIGKLEPLEEERSIDKEVTSEDSLDNLTYIGDYYDLKEGTKPFEDIKYLPIIMVVFIFLFVNWVFFFL